ncbi:phosphoadenosine phosphosulfate reductase family protein [Nitrosovibrio sp. Nv6]|uniref:phosphoadenosine phosphosulfate reductase domain-containing protein n=1 Tax=Nitrosovibrio sp. Nv6 TaxID=1855340 RepID=UPI0008C42F3C|nr:phosphoadenosine phosphosulfate reductase family protein [Nitrosovibrio sp. Nv6]SEO77486.1 phosphoadenosine phosphosulfate reductase [Nitrosovibrio sp. Nv6]
MRVLAFSGGKDSMACLHLLRGSIDLAIYVDTGKSYPETRQMVEYASKIVPVITVEISRDRQNADEGLPADVVPINWTKLGQMVTGRKPTRIQSYLGCCFQNISLPIIMKAKEIGANEIVYGQRADEGHKSTSRNGDITEGIVRLQPIEDWTSQQVLDYLATKMEVPAHYSIKHSSLDCYDCTAYRKESTDRVEFTRTKYPKMYAEYTERLNLLNAALAESME